eukprot:CAMPEP_0197449876 /NCGR_PEP_ID=MMETSP1175-20131217/23250_1 /TAXON_ID=1003142 /ORGANISM="Triceratium dubium, Strain CCMP147" /LENGTH=514 /DNA_ID=CAMNT_0042982137 /DNA_START=373 /DNA_END=1917 /DNA_ORIENTATION=-
MIHAISQRSTRSVRTEATEFPDSRRIHDEVGEAAKRYDESRAKLLRLMASLKKQHHLMVKTSEKRLETAKQFENFLADTPLSKMVSEVGSAEAKTKVFARSQPEKPKTREKEEVEPVLSPPLETIESGDTGSRNSGSAEAQKEEELLVSRSSSSVTSEETGEREDNIAGGEAVLARAKEDYSIDGNMTEEGILITGDEAAGEEIKEELDGKPEAKPAESDEEIARRLAKQWEEEAEEWKGSPVDAADDAIIQACGTDVTESIVSHDSSVPELAADNKPRTPPASKGKKNEKEKIPHQQAFPPLVVDGSDFDKVDHSYGAVHEAAHKLTDLYADQYSSNIIKYVEEWDKASYTRIQGRLLEFERMKSNLEHYVQKVDGLRSGIKKREGSNRKISPKASQRFDRNELKLGGAREAYDSYGESLLLLLEEVTDRAWRDCFPLLMRAMQFDVNFSSDQAKVFSALNETVERLEKLGVGREVDPDGRIRSLKESKPEEIYTGGKNVVPPVHSTRDVYEV